MCTLLCLAAQGFAIAQTDTSTPAQKPASASTAAQSQLQSGAHATTKPTTHHSSSHSSSTAQKSKSSHARKGAKPVAKKRGQQAIDPARAREIQTALIREHYLQGEPSGTWDAATQAAMQRYQADQGWQSKTTPDSRALIKLGLGPSHDHLLNPESAMTTPAPAAAGDPKAAKPTADGLPKQ